MDCDECRLDAREIQGAYVVNMSGFSLVVKGSEETPVFKRIMASGECITLFIAFRLTL